MKKKYIIRLSGQESQACLEVIKKLKGTSQKVRRAQILLKADADGPAWTDAKIAEAFNCRIQTLENLRKRLVTEGFGLTLNAKNRRHLLCSMGKPKQNYSPCDSASHPQATDDGRYACWPKNWSLWR